MTSEEVVRTRKYEVVSQLPNETEFKNIGLIGSCDSLFNIGWNRVQNWSLTEQIYHGVRVFEFLLCYHDGEFFCVGSSIFKSFRSFKSVLDELRQYLKYQHPDEFFLLNLKSAFVHPHLVEEFVKTEGLVLKGLNSRTPLKELRGKVICLSIDGYVQMNLESLSENSIRKFIRAFNTACPDPSCLCEVYFKGKLGLFGNRRLKFVEEIIQQRSKLRIKRIVGIYYFDFIDKFIEAKMI